MSQKYRSTDRFSLYDHLQICYEGFTNEIPVRVPDLSTLGMFINTALTFPEGAILRISFILPRTNAQVHARSEVRYCLPGVGVGVEFINLDDEHVKSIERELSTHALPEGVVEPAIEISDPDEELREPPSGSHSRGGAMI